MIKGNGSLARSRHFYLLNITGDVLPCTLGNCADITDVSGSRANDLVVAFLNDSAEISLLTFIKCNQIPLLLSRDNPRVHNAHQQINATQCIICLMSGLRLG